MPDRRMFTNSKASDMEAVNNSQLMQNNPMFNGNLLLNLYVRLSRVNLKMGVILTALVLNHHSEPLTTVAVVLPSGRSTVELTRMHFPKWEQLVWPHSRSIQLIQRKEAELAISSLARQSILIDELNEADQERAQKSFT